MISPFVKNVVRELKESWALVYSPSEYLYLPENNIYLYGLDDLFFEIRISNTYDEPHWANVGGKIKFGFCERVYIWNTLRDKLIEIDKIRKFNKLRNF